jgi:hypothetical protein
MVALDVRVKLLSITSRAFFQIWRPVSISQTKTSRFVFITPSPFGGGVGEGADRQSRLAAAATAQFQVKSLVVSMKLSIET